MECGRSSGLHCYWKMLRSRTIQGVTVQSMTVGRKTACMSLGYINPPPVRAAHEYHQTRTSSHQQGFCSKLCSVPGSCYPRGCRLHTGRTCCLDDHRLDLSCSGSLGSELDFDLGDEGKDWRLCVGEADLGDDRGCLVHYEHWKDYHTLGEII